MGNVFTKRKRGYKTPWQFLAASVSINMFWKRAVPKRSVALWECLVHPIYHLPSFSYFCITVNSIITYPATACPLTRERWQMLILKTVTPPPPPPPIVLCVHLLLRIFLLSFFSFLWKIDDSVGRGIFSRTLPPLTNVSPHLTSISCTQQHMHLTSFVALDPPPSSLCLSTFDFGLTLFLPLSYYREILPLHARGVCVCVLVVIGDANL